MLRRFVLDQPRDEDRRRRLKALAGRSHHLAKWTIRPKLMAIPGVANVAIWGQRDRQFQVLVDPALVGANEVSLDLCEGGNRGHVARRRRFSRYAQSAHRRAAIARRASRPMRPERHVVDFRGGAPLRLGDVPKWSRARRRRSGTRSSTTGRAAADRRKAAHGKYLGSDPRGRSRARGPAAGAARTWKSTPAIFRPATFIERPLRQSARCHGARLHSGHRDPGRSSSSTGAPPSSA